MQLLICFLLNVAFLGGKLDICYKSDYKYLTQPRFLKSETTLEDTNKNFNLAEYAFQELLVELKQGDNNLFKQIFLNQVAESIQYLKIKYHATHDDAYDAVLETLLTYRQRLVEGKVSYGNLRFLFLQMASQQYLRSLSKLKIVSDDVVIDLPDAIDQNTYSEDEIDQLGDAWKLLNESCQELLRLNYYQGLKLNEIAEQTGKSPEAIRKQKERCKEALITNFKNASNGKS